MLLPRQRLMVLLNEVYYSGGNIIEVSYPPLDLLYSITLGERCRLSILNKTEYNEKRIDTIKTIGESGKEIPNFNSYIDTITASGILPPKNAKEIETAINEKCMRDIFKGDKMLFIGFDTNILMLRQNRMIIDIYRNRGGICLSYLLSRELARKWDRKYRFEDLQNLHPQMAFMENFPNQPVLSARAARLGSVEYRLIRNNPHTREIMTGDGADLEIVSSYKKFERDNDVDVVLVSGDMNFAGMARDAHMNVIQVKKQTDASQRIEIDWEQAAELIYTSAITYGYVSLNGMDIYGIWTGKTDDDWNAENLSITLEGELARKIKRDMEILQ
ncbi:hypothetical protein ANME2D_00450 [Candidatus Methanoperedens nitroreducens]|uniref:NYN domain-containing protein n=2 Tax=Candidatus Methanoperedens nitratireducens TaxID=1392998 RepID=A0A062VCI1_9EURY|nr:hypothetical protein ANME2D_00450 [Candidatus Methanoperedens nitroreducens]